MPRRLFCTALVGLVLLGGCERAQPTPPAPTSPPADEAPAPPTPPIRETFDASPQLSLFPRLGDYRPPDEDPDNLALWLTFVEHLVKTSGVVYTEMGGGNRAWSFRGLRDIDSTGFFSPLAVQPLTSYRVSFRLKADLPEGGSAGVGILEYDEFLWIGEQFTADLDARHRSGEQEGLRLTGDHDWSEQSFIFTTGPRTRMIHLVLFREGSADRRPVGFDDILIEPLPR
ncbi:hypothetical protein [Geoalkalibacter halelectricus]|uniref:hypothetical protein n=1 Tax=Geoalkalibacter halelectricus TaxID=2847045 RepID=UPI00266ED4C1|nr:hypothetical protein [Geoalkalibacter halelectricus]MDO3378769.1 hypothetical protein [Geoalkalibacter halelectricus]